MEPELNCSSQCEPPLCSIHAGVNRQESLDILQRLCSLSSVAVELPRRSLSPVLCAVVWTLLSCGILLALGFLVFTLRFKNNRIVKMSSPNLNILTLLGSVLTCSSGFLFAVDGRPHAQAGASTAVLQARVWTLCVGSTLMFGPILGKTWRLYRVFTQRVPDKRVIIRDIQLMGMVALLILGDLVVLTAWNLTDPIRCSRSIGAVVKVGDKYVSYTLSQLDSCSSVYSDLWVIIIIVKKGCLLLYGTYLAGLTSNVSQPPVNQSPTIIAAVTLVTLCSSVAVPVSLFLQAWPNLVYSAVAGAIFICTLATNCMLFVPQLTEWRQFEEDHNNPSQMAKYFSSPSKSQPSVYSQDEIFYLLGENSSMKKLISEKNAVIDSLQEQVNNAKDKLLRLMSASQPSDDQDMDSSATNLHSSCTQTTELQSYSPPASLPQRDSEAPVSAPPVHPPTSEPATAPTVAPSPLRVGDEEVGNHGDASKGGGVLEPRAAEAQKASYPPPGFLRTAEETVDFVTSLQNGRGLSDVEPFGVGLPAALSPSARPAGFVSSEQLQEILQELSVDAVMLRSLSHPGRTPSQGRFEGFPLSPLSLHLPRSPNPPPLFRYPSISPYAMRKRRPPFHSPRRVLSPPCFYTGSEAAAYGRTRDGCDAASHGRLPEGGGEDGALRRGPDSDLEGEEEDEEDDRLIRKCPKCVSGKPPAHLEHECGVPPHAEAGANGERRHRHARDSGGYWDSDSSGSTNYCFYHRPYCESCLQRGSLLSSDSSSSDSSDSEYDGYGLYRPARPVVFKDDLKPTFV